MRPRAGFIARLADRAADARNRLVASPSFQSFAARFPLFRPLANRRARELFDLCAGFVYAQTLYALVELRVFERLRAGPLSSRDIADACGLPLDGADRLLRAAAALDLLAPRSGDRWGLAEKGAALLGNPSVFDMIRHHQTLYADLADPVALFRARPRGGLADYWGYKEEGGGETERYSDLMASTQGFIAEDVIAAYPFRRHRTILDLGGGSGAFLAQIAKSAPRARLVLADLPAVAELARARFAREGLAERAEAVGLDFLRDAPPGGCDLVTLVRVLHDHDDDDVAALLRRVRASIPPGGRLLVAEPMAGTRGAEAMGDAYFGVYLWALGSGRPRTESEIRGALAAAGFSRVRAVATPRPLLVRVLAAE